MAQNPNEIEIDPIEITIPVSDEAGTEEMIRPKNVGGSTQKAPPTFDVGENFLQLYNEAEDLQTGETISLEPSKRIEFLLNDVAEILSENPYYLEKGGINIADLKTGRGPVFEKLFPEFFDINGNGTEALSDFYDKDDYEKEKILLSRLTNLEEAGLEDYLKEAAKGGAEGYIGARSAFTAGRLAFQATLPLTGVNPLIPPAAGILTGLGTAILSSYATSPISEFLAPRRKNLLPGESSELEGVKTFMNILAGAPVTSQYALKAYGPSVTLQRLRDAGPVKTTRSQRFSAYLDEMLPKTRELYEKDPRKFLKAEAALAGLTGATVYQFELDQDPLLRTAVELGLGLSPTYTFVDLAQRANENKFKPVKSALKLYQDYGLLGAFFLTEKGAQRRENWKNLFKGIREKFVSENDDINFLRTKEGQRAAYKVLQFFVQNGEDPQEVLRNLKNGVDWLDGLPQEALDIINAKGAGGVRTEEAIENITPGMRSGSPTLIMLENFFRTQSEEIKNSRDPIGQKAASFQKALIKLFSIGGEKEQLEIARELQQNLFTERMIMKLSDAVDKATSSALQLSKGKDEFGKLRDISVAQTRALEQQFDFANGMAAALYEEAKKAGEIGKITEFLDFDGQVLEVPSFIKRWDEMLAEKSDEVLDRWRRDPFFSTTENLINKFKTQLNLEDAPAATSAQLKLDSTLKKQEYSEAREIFQRLLNNDFDFSKSGEKYQNPPIIAVNDEGIPLATERNIENLTILMDRFVEAVKTPRVKSLLQMQKEALQAEIALEKGVARPREGIEFNDLLDLGKELTTWKAQSTGKGNDLHGVAAQMKKAVFDDMNNSIPADVSQAFNVAKSFIKDLKMLYREVLLEYLLEEKGITNV